MINSEVSPLLSQVPQGIVIPESDVLLLDINNHSDFAVHSSQE